MKAVDPDGTTWKVRRRITPWRRYFGGTFDGLSPEPQHPWNRGKLGTMQPTTLGGGDSSYFIAMVKLPFLAFLLPFIIVLRLLLSSSWTVEVFLDGQLWREEKAGRWTASGQRADRLVSEIRAGIYPERTTLGYPNQG